MPMDLASRTKFNLKGASVLVVETLGLSTDILVQILVGFGAKDLQRADSIAAAQGLIAKTPFDLAVVGSPIGEQDGHELVEWIRKAGPDANKYLPIVMVAAHTARTKVERARDCGAHFVIAKPLKPIVLLERILWIVREQRRFVAADFYTGPDRRFKFDGPPDGSSGRRRDDLSANLGEAVAPNMSQDQIDALLSGRSPSV